MDKQEAIWNLNTHDRSVYYFYWFRQLKNNSDNNIISENSYLKRTCHEREQSNIILQGAADNWASLTLFHLIDTLNSGSGGCRRQFLSRTSSIVLREWHPTGMSQKCFGSTSNFIYLLETHNMLYSFITHKWHQQSFTSCPEPQQVFETTTL